MTGADPRVAEFHRLHASGTFVMANPWDAGSARVLQQLIRRTPSVAASATVTKGALISRFTGSGPAASTTARTCSTVLIRGAYRQSAPACA